MNKQRDEGSYYRRSGSQPVPGRPVPKNLGQSRGGGQRGPRDYHVDDAALEEIDDFRPPNPKNPLAGAKPAVVLGAFLTIAGILSLIIFPFLPVTFPGWMTVALIGVVFLGLLVLFLQMPSKRTGSGDGAQV